MLPFVFEDGFGYERYLDYALDVPMYFVFRDGHYIDVAGQSFRDFLEGRLPGLPARSPRVSDFTDHLSTIFPEVRLKSFLEMRGADGGPWSRICALPALWVGLLYDEAALDAAWDEVKDWTLAERQALRDAVPKLGLQAATPARRDARRARQARPRHRRGGAQRPRPPQRVRRQRIGLPRSVARGARSGKTPAERLLERYHGEWHGDISRIYEEESF